MMADISGAKLYADEVDEEDSASVEDWEDNKVDTDVVIQCAVTGTQETRPPSSIQIPGLNLIPGVNKVTGQVGHVVFVIRVTIMHKNVPDIKTSWTINRRYKRFEHLHAQLAKMVDKSKMPSLPQKQLLRSFNAEYLNKKRQALEVYLQTLLTIPQAVRSDALCSFLVGNFSALLPYLHQAKQMLDQQRQAVANANEAEKQRAVAIAQLSQARSALEEARSGSSQVEKKSADTLARVAELEAQVTKAKAEAMEARLLAETTQTQSRALEARNQTLEADLATMPGDLARFQTELAEKAKSIAVLEQQVAVLKQHKKLLAAEVRRLQSTVAGAGAGSANAGAAAYSTPMSPTSPEPHVHTRSSSVTGPSAVAPTAAAAQAALEEEQVLRALESVGVHVMSPPSDAAGVKRPIPPPGPPPPGSKR